MEKRANRADEKAREEVTEIRVGRARAARCMRRSRERVGSLNSLVHSRALRFGFPVCMRACPSVRPSVRSCSRSSRARSYADASLAPTMRRGLSARRKKKKRRKEKEKRETARARLRARKRRGGEGGKKKKECREDKRANAEARKRTTGCEGLSVHKS